MDLDYILTVGDVNFKKLGFQRVSLLIVGLEQGLEH